MSIQRKLNLVLAAVVLVASIVLAALAAWLEQRAVLETKQKHAEHVAAWVALDLEERGAQADLRATLREVSQRLSEATGERHRLLLLNGQGEVLGGREAEGEAPGSAAPALVARRRLAWSDAAPGAQERWIQVEEPMDRDLDALASRFAQHLGLAAFLSALVMVTVGILVSRLICRPVKALAEAVDPVGREGHWEPLELPSRRNDEIGLLIDRVAELGRRLAPEVRSERFEAAHLVATRVQREMAEPVRELEMRVAALGGFIPSNSDGSQLVQEIAERVAALREFQRRLQEV